MENYKKTEHFEAIAMKCTNEQFEEIKPILEGFGFHVEISNSYRNKLNSFLTNNFAENKECYLIDKSLYCKENGKIYGTWNSETFLKACGIEKVMETPTLEQVKKHFENAKEVKGLYSEDNYIIDVEKFGVYFENNNIRQNTNEKDERILLYDFDLNKYAEIISYKEKTYTLTETFVKELCKELNIKEAFVREGIVEDELCVGFYYWIKHNALDDALVFIQNKDVEYTYGFNHKKEYTTIYRNDLLYTSYKNDVKRKATPQEVETALKNEAKKRGYVYGILIVDIYNGKSNKDLTIVSSNEFIYETIKAGENQGQMALRDTDGNVLFHNGTWAEIIEETRTIEIPLKDILATPNNYELGEMVRKLANEKL